jgi:hypothetical protein
MVCGTWRSTTRIQRGCRITFGWLCSPGHGHGRRPLVRGISDMNNSLFAAAIDCADAPALARFWADVLGRQVAEDSASERVALLVGDGDTGSASYRIQEGSGAQTVAPSSSSLPPAPRAARCGRSQPHASSTAGSALRSPPPEAPRTTRSGTTTCSPIVTCSSRTGTRYASCTPARCSGPRRSVVGDRRHAQLELRPLPRHRGA